jgi:hypothetical protein
MNLIYLLKKDSITFKKKYKKYNKKAKKKISIIENN